MGVLVSGPVAMRLRGHPCNLDAKTIAGRSRGGCRARQGGLAPLGGDNPLVCRLVVVGA